MIQETGSPQSPQLRFQTAASNTIHQLRLLMTTDASARQVGVSGLPAPDGDPLGEQSPVFHNTWSPRSALKSIGGVHSR